MWERGIAMLAKALFWRLANGWGRGRLGRPTVEQGVLVSVSGPSNHATLTNASEICSWSKLEPPPIPWMLNSRSTFGWTNAGDISPGTLGRRRF